MGRDDIDIRLLDYWLNELEGDILSYDQIRDEVWLGKDKEAQ